MQITLNIEDSLFTKASQLTGITEYAALIREGLKALIDSETDR
jgi:hypothetical protein